MSERDEARKRVFVGRRAGMSPEKREEMEKAAAAAEWHGVCRRCKAQIKGTLEECRAHKCADNPILPTVD